MRVGDRFFEGGAVAVCDGGATSIATAGMLSYGSDVHRLKSSDGVRSTSAIVTADLNVSLCAATSSGRRSKRDTTLAQTKREVFILFDRQCTAGRNIGDWRES